MEQLNSPYLEKIRLRRWANKKVAALHLKVCENFLDKDRLTGLHGIPFHRLGRLVRYDLNELDDWLAQRCDGAAV